MGRQQQKKVAALMAEAAAKRAMAKMAGETPQGGEDVCDSASASTATTEEESSSCESTTSSSSRPSPERACARKKNSKLQESTGTMRHNARCYWIEYKKQQYAKMMHLQQQHQHLYHQQAAAHYNQAASVMQHPQPQMYPDYAAGYGYPPQEQVQRPRNSKKWNKSRYLTKEETDLYVALDCEMVGVGPHGQDSALARVTLINWNGDIIMDELVKPQWTVTDYRTFVSGITKEMLDSATMDFATARFLVMKHLAGKILVGHGLKNDLGVLGINHPWYMIRDTAKYEPFMKVRYQDGCLWPRGLKELTREKLGRAIQVYGRPHCPKEDAKAALDLYKLVWRQWESSIEYKMSKNMAFHHPAQHAPAVNCTPSFIASY